MPKPPSRLTTPTLTRYLVTWKNMSQALMAHLERYKRTQLLLSDCGLIGTPLRVCLSGLGGKKCSVCVQSMYDDVVELSSPLLAGVQFVDCVISALFSVSRKIESRRRQLLLHQSP